MSAQRVSGSRHQDVKSPSEGQSRHVRQLISSREIRGRGVSVAGPGGAVTGALDESANVLSSRHVKTDDVLESLQRRLKDQASSRAPDGESVQEGSRSGAVVPRTVRRRGLRIQERNAPDQRRRNELKRIGQHVSKTEELVSLSSSLGIGMAKVVPEISRARVCLGKEETVKAKRLSASANRSAREMIAQTLPQLIKETSARIAQLESVGVSLDVMRHLLGRAANAQKKGAYAESLLLLIEARKRIQRSEDGAILRILLDAKGRFVMAKRLGLNINDAVVLLTRARDELRRGDFTKAIDDAKQSRIVVETLLEQHRKARVPMLECMKAIKLAEVLGADISEMNALLAEARHLFKRNELERSADCSRKLLILARQEAHGRASESYGLAERALTLAKGTGADLPESEEKLKKARELLESGELAKSVSMACASMVESDSAIANALSERLRKIDDFAQGIERDVDSLTEVQEAIETSRERNLENLRKYANMAESTVGEAYESAAAYARVAQDVVKQAYDRSTQVDGVKEMMSRNADGLVLPSEAASAEKAQFNEKRQRLVNLYLKGKVSEGQLDKLLLMVDSSIAKDNLV